MPHLGLGYPKSSSLSNCHKKRYTISLVSGSRKEMTTPESLKFRYATQVIPLLLNTNTTSRRVVRSICAEVRPIDPLQLSRTVLIQRSAQMM